MRAEAEKRIGHLYPKVEITAEMAPEAAKIAKKLGLKCAMYTPSFFAAPIFKDGAMTSNDPKVRKLGLENALRAVDTTALRDWAEALELTHEDAPKAGFGAAAFNS